ncbi:MAG: phosphoenolpyruvate--protein phosphotransferase, partial [Treponema sp.]|nr:phosphoenolpyruvate--protein phosphotransferase [Treponema sp.]
TYALPAIFGIADITRYIVNGETMIVDGNSGTVYATPHDTLLNDYRKKYADERIRRQKVRASVSEPAVTKDGTSFALFANIGTVEEARWAQEAGADGIGLFRTEFLYMQEGRAIDEEQQVAAYSAVLKVMAGKPVTIRTLDSGGDKQITVPGSLQYAEKNPLMGLRAIRASLAAPDFFRTQLRALYRASVHGNLRIMVPLVTTVEQVQQCRILAKEVQQELTEKNISYDKSVPFGVMIETPAAAIASDRLAEVSDFFSIGTNDLTQYTLAVDRENTAVAALYDECNISVLRLIARTIEHATTARIPVSVCGELAGRRDGVAVLAGIGVRHMSMNVSCLETVREMLCSSTLADFRLISDGYLNKI